MTLDKRPFSHITCTSCLSHKWAWYIHFRNATVGFRYLTPEPGMFNIPSSANSKPPILGLTISNSTLPSIRYTVLTPSLSHKPTHHKLCIACRGYLITVLSLMPIFVWPTGPLRYMTPRETSYMNYTKSC